MTTKQTNNKEETIVLKGQSKGGDNSRNRTASLIALVLIPFIFLATLHLFMSGGLLENIFWIYNQFFKVVLGLGLLYALHELINFITPKETQGDEYTGNMIIFSIVFGIWYFSPVYFDIFFALSGVDHLSIFELFIFNMSRDTWSNLTNFLVPTLFVIGILITVIFNFNIKDEFVIAFTAILITMFFRTFATATTDGGWETIFLVLLVVVTSDTMAYYGGKKFGKTKIFPKVSPNKTFEGLVTGFASAIAVGYIFYVIAFVFFGTDALDLVKGDIFDTSSTSAWWFLVIPAIAAIAPLGDLYFSKIKRTYEKKDFSDLLPGHGGLLDRIDSHILAFTLLGLIMIIL